MWKGVVLPPFQENGERPENTSANQYPTQPPSGTAPSGSKALNLESRK